MEIELRDGWWVPKADEVCLAKVIEDLPDLHQIYKHCKDIGHLASRTCIQAGGNFGVWPHEMGKAFGEVITFEADPISYECLRRNLIAKDGRLVRHYNEALGAKKSLGTMEYPEGARNPGAHRVVWDQGGGSIQVRTIDATVPAFPVSLIQLDIEGAEHDAILGAQRTISAWKPVVVLELKGLGVRYGHTDDDTRVLMATLGYHEAQRVHRDSIFIHGSPP